MKVGGGGYSMGGACCRHYGQGGGRLWVGRALIGAWALTRGNAVFTKVVVVSGGYLSEPRSGKEVATSTSVNGTLF